MKVKIISQVFLGPLGHVSEGVVEIDDFLARDLINGNKAEKYTGEPKPEVPASEGKKKGAK